MPNDRYRVLFVATHPVQYQSPIFRRMAQHPRLHIDVAYCSLQGAEARVDPEFGIEVKWDVPLLEGYPWMAVPNRSPRPGLGRFFGLMNPGLWRLAADGAYDAVVAYTGYNYVSFWILAAAAKVRGLPLLFGTDAHGLVPLDGKNWKIPVKRVLWPLLFRLADVVIVPSSRSATMLRSIGIPEERLAVTPYVVDNDWWKQEAEKADRAATRRAWKVPEHGRVVLFCAKLQPWKRPLDVLRAFASAKVADSFLVFAGEGPLRGELEAQTAALGLEPRVRFLGFVNQSQLPAVYRSSDLLVLPSAYEAFGVVINEAMLCGCVPVVSDRVGAVGDLVDDDENGAVFRCGDVAGLAAILKQVLPDADRLRRLADAARSRMQTWSPAENVAGLIQAVERAMLHKAQGPGVAWSVSRDG